MLSQSASQEATVVHARMTVVVTTAEATVAHAATTVVRVTKSLLKLQHRTTSRRCSKHQKGDTIARD
jgi:hypothetical protein